MSRRKKRERKEHPPPALNIMPFIDIFSMLNTFLLVSAAFVNIGIIEVQVPFLTNAPPPKEKPARSLEIHVSVERDKVELETKYDQPPIDENKTEYKLTEADLKRMHKDLVELRKNNPDSDKVNVHSEDDVKYQNLVSVLDTIMVREQGDPVFAEEDSEGEKTKNDFIFRKIVMANVIL